MANIREIKKRIKVAQKIQQVTRAMAMVASVRLRRAQDKALAVRPYVERMMAMLGRLAPEPSEAGSHPLFAPRDPVMRVLLVPLTADKGLCGSYNTNIIRRAAATIHAMPQAKVTLYPLGRKGYDYFRRIRAPIVKHRLDLTRMPTLRQASEVAKELIEMFLSGEYDEVRVVYSRFVSAAVQRVEVERYLPITLPAEAAVDRPIAEPSDSAALDALAGEWLKTRMCHYFREASAGELGARRTAMDAATDNASEIIAGQTLALNRARQTAITMEILDIINAAEGVK